MSDPVAARIEELRADREHGSSWMARRAVEALAELARGDAATSDELLERLVGAGRELCGARPRVGAIAGAVGRLLAAASHECHLELDDMRRVVVEEAQALVDSKDRAAASIAIQLRPRIDGQAVLTHSASATVREALLRGGPSRVVCTVTAPHEEGRGFADELRGEGLEVELVEDGDAARAVADVSLLLLGADTVFRDGTVCNKIGTRPLAEAASASGVPVVIACEVIKLAPIDATDAPEPRKHERALFDLTPPELVDEVVTEEGVFASESVRALVDRTPFLRDGYALLGPLPANA